jgi:uncharacterized protein
MTTSPDFAGLVRFLVQPFLDSSSSLRVDCESSSRTGRVLVRLAFEGEDKGRVFGRGGRNIQAVRTVLQAVALAAGKVAHLEVYGGQSSAAKEVTVDRPPSSNKPRPTRAPRREPPRS